MRSLLNQLASYRERRGFTLLLSALISSIVLALGTSIFVIAQKQLTLSQVGRDSQFAFYAADTGAECALYWDLRQQEFGVEDRGIHPTCDQKEFVPTGRQAAPPYVMEFQINLFVNGDGIPMTADDNGYCADVKVYKNTSNPFTVVHADGYSVRCEDINTSSRALQRSVEIRY